MTDTDAGILAGTNYEPYDMDLLFDPVPTSRDPNPPMKLEHDNPVLVMPPIVSADARR